MCSRHGIRFLILGKIVHRVGTYVETLTYLYYYLYIGISDTVFNYLLAYRIAQIA